MDKTPITLGTYEQVRFKDLFIDGEWKTTAIIVPWGCLLVWGMFGWLFKGIWWVAKWALKAVFM